MLNQKNYILAAVVLVIAGSIYFINSKSVNKSNSGDVVTVTPRVSTDNPDLFATTTSSTTDGVLNKTQTQTTMNSKYLSSKEKSKKYELAKEITTPNGFINSDGEPITIGQYVGKKVVLIDFWTYSCINCQRTTPYLNSWFDKYEDDGLVIIGIHTPEFEFEKDYKNVTDAVNKFGIKFPVVLDNDYSTWAAYRNQYWPRKYLIDIDGYIVYDHIGEGQYEETEKKIKLALEERAAVLGVSADTGQSITKEIPIPFTAKSPETYFGSLRNSNFGNGVAKQAGIQNNLSIPMDLKLNTLYLDGNWNIQGEYAENLSSDSKIAFKYSAKEVYFVGESESEITIEVLKDGSPIGDGAGSDIIKTSDGKTIFKVKDARLYKIINSGELENHTLEFIIKGKNMKAFTFTFG